jgi:hypothetical protein
MSYFISHHSCPKCGSSDAYAEYDDGHFWCFSCKHFVPANALNIKQVERQLIKTVKGVRPLPLDYTLEIPKEPYIWLKKYSLTNEEITNNKLGWSQSESMLIFPYFGEESNVICWQGRFFPARSPKVYTCGFPDSHILLHHSGDRNTLRRVVVVEDAISAIKVSRVCDSSELLGSNLSMHKAVGLSRTYSHLTLWLDYDKIKEMIKFIERYRSLYDKIDMVVTKTDPKEHSTEQIKEILKYE